MERTTMILGRNHCGIHSWVVAIYIDGKYITEYTRGTREKARELARKFKETGMLPTN